MMFTVVYYHNGKPIFKNVESKDAESAKKLLEQELKDVYYGYCEMNHKESSEEGFKKHYKI